MSTDYKFFGESDFHSVLVQTEVLTSSAEIHGTLCGFICVGKHLDGSFYLDNLLRCWKDTIYSRVWPQEVIIDLYDKLCRQLGGLDKTFRLLLPDKQHTLMERTKALHSWCHGFLYGLDMGTSAFKIALSEKAYAALRCITAIAQIDFQTLAVEHQNNSLYEESLLFITGIVPLIYEELSDPSRVNQLGTNDLVHLH